MTGLEEDILASRKVPQGQKMNKVLDACIQQIGSLTDAEASKSIPELLMGDRTFLFFALRLVTHGPEFPFRKKCPECRNISTYNFRLDELPIYEMPEPKKRLYQAVLPVSGYDVEYRPLCGRDEAQREQLKRRLEPLTLSILMHIVNINGKPPASDVVQRLTARDRDHLRGLFEEMEGGIETTITLHCHDTSCGAEFDAEIDPGDPAFFSPSATRKRWKRRSSF
jgi:hypothetical protein